MQRRWDSWSPQQAAALLGDVRAPWWIAGGWAIDLHLGERARAHDDLDVGVLRRDLPEILAAFGGWQIFEAHRGELARLSASDRNKDVGFWTRCASRAPTTAGSWRSRPDSFPAPPSAMLEAERTEQPPGTKDAPLGGLHSTVASNGAAARCAGLFEI